MFSRQTSTPSSKAPRVLLHPPQNIFIFYFFPTAGAADVNSTEVIIPSPSSKQRHLPIYTTPHLRLCQAYIGTTCTELAQAHPRYSSFWILCSLRIIVEKEVMFQMNPSLLFSSGGCFSFFLKTPPRTLRLVIILS